MPFWCGIRCNFFGENYGCGCVWAVPEINCVIIPAPMVCHCRRQFGRGFDPGDLLQNRETGKPRKWLGRALGRVLGKFGMLESAGEGAASGGSLCGTSVVRRIKSTPDPDTFEKYRNTPPISIAILLQEYALLLAGSSIYTTNLYHDTPPICIAILLQKY